MYGRTCPDCGANLDPGEKCDCKKEEKQISDHFANVGKMIGVGLGAEREIKNLSI